MEEFMKTMKTRYGRWVAACAVVSCMLAGVMLTPTVQARSLGRAAAATPAPGGSFTVWGSTPTNCQDPQTGRGGGLNNYVLDSLYTTNEKGKLQGNLATGYKLSKGGK